jgi:single-strand DNA-binding protein
MNKVILKGRLTSDPVQRYIRDEISVTSFSVAVNRPYDKEKKADFINVVAWNKQAELIKKYFTKGQEIAIVGRLESNQYVDKDTQKKLTSYQVVTEEIEFCGTKKEKEEDPEEKTTLYKYETENTEDDDILPF